jgi:hypothetical protein
LSKFSALTASLVISLSTMMTPVAYAQTDFMSPEAEGGGGRFGGRPAAPQSQVQTPVVPSKSLGANDEDERQTTGAVVKNGYQTKSGLKYFDVREGTGESPRYGDLVTFNYIINYKPEDRDSALEVVSKSVDPYLQKHGNGRIVRGLDEGLHTMKVGGRRRIIVPRSIGYTDIGVGPLPSDYRERRRLGDVIDYLLADRGELIFDVELVQVLTDENDQGYYDDIPVTQQEVRDLVERSLKAKQAREGTQEQKPAVTFEQLDKKNS